MKPTIAITAGDINGVGYEVILKTLRDPHITEICRPIVYGNAKVAKQHAQTLGEEYTNIQFNLIQDAGQARDGRLNLITCYPDTTPVQLGVSTPEAGQASFAALERACADLKSGKVHALVTAPINKENIQSDSFRFSGHTEYLTAMFADCQTAGAVRPLTLSDRATRYQTDSQQSGQTAGGDACAPGQQNGQISSAKQQSLMMMVSETMRVALVCNHVAIAEVPAQITEEHILQKLTLLNETLQRDFSVRKPRIAVLALNPHAGDKGLIGEEEQTIIRPTIEKACEQGIWAFGPYSADGFFGSGHFTHFDAVLAMYHDQGLIPFKTLDMSGVNFTAGLPIVRTSPDHGTAYDLAGKNQANHLSFAHALYAAIDILHTRKQNAELTQDPLPFTLREDREDRRPRREFMDFKTTV
ncbi:MAG: 4-hydroxythreonine-4-phosphate dehydrogenase PdxA [Paludibacteraceae bacterium]|nr:4-hydroxythreonine-4-phosphate dehydrogenase PdxA [Paludibacteraceae bacterium]